MLEWTRLDKKFVEFPVSATLADGTPALVSGVDVALLTYGQSPSAATVWASAIYEDGVVKVLVAGPDSDPTGAVLVLFPAMGGDLWARVSDNPEVDMSLIARIVLE